MKTILQILTEKVSAAFLQCGYSAHLGSVTLSDRPDLCQFQCNGAFAGAKLYQKAPRIIADEVAAQLADDALLKNVSVVGAGFINLSLTDQAILSYIDAMLADKNLGIPQSERQEIIFLDYGGPNVAKPLHVGHLRAAVIGEACKRLAQATGRKTVSDVHLGDWGLQMGLVIAGLEERYGNYPAEISLSSDTFDEIYPNASKKSKEIADFLQKAQDITAELQKGNAEYLALLEKIMRVSIADIKANYQLLNVSFDLWYGESTAEKYVDELLTLLRTKGLLTHSMGAKVVDVSEPSDKAEIPPVIIQKSNGANVYATMDLATILQREKDFHPDEIWYVVDSRQSLHLTQVFRCAKKAGIVPQATVLRHVGFGTMNGSDGKPYKTRDGGVMKLSDFFQLVYQAVYQKVQLSSHSHDADKQETAKRITVAAIKFGDLMNDRLKDYVFDVDKFTASEGKTGAFLLYTIARINSVLAKAEQDKNEAEAPTLIYSQTERQLWLKLALTNEAFLSAYDEKAPHLLCENAYQTAAEFSKFYAENHILTETDSIKRASWLKLCRAAKAVLLKQLDVLGIEPAAYM